MVPPCGVPVEVAWNSLLKMYPAFGRCFRSPVFVDLLSEIAVVDVVETALYIRIQNPFWFSYRASCDLFYRVVTPHCRPKTVTIWFKFRLIGSSACLVAACVALSLIVGIPNGRVFPLALGVVARLVGMGLYLSHFVLVVDRTSSANAIFSLGVLRFLKSTPPVLSVVARLTAGNVPLVLGCNGRAKFLAFPCLPGFAAL